MKHIKFLFMTARMRIHNKKSWRIQGKHEEGQKKITLSLQPKTINVYIWYIFFYSLLYLALKFLALIFIVHIIS